MGGEVYNTNNNIDYNLMVLKTIPYDEDVD